jgi:hypothetical protein
MNNKIKNKVENILRKYPESRDADTDLLARYRWYELIDMGIPYDTVKMICELYLKSLTPADTITRARRKLQQIDESLRGNSYEKRKVLEKEYRHEIVKV